MDNYIIELFGGTTIEITEDDYRAVIGATGLVMLQSCGQTINIAAIRRIAPKKVYEIDKMLEGGKQQEGILHDGTLVTRYFGQWYLVGDIDERGKPSRIIDPAHYPEIVRDCVPTPAEYHLKYSALPRHERLEKMIAEHRERIQNYISVAESLDNAWKRLETFNLQSKKGQFPLKNSSES